MAPMLSGMRVGSEAIQVKARRSVKICGVMPMRSDGVALGALGPRRSSSRDAGYNVGVLPPSVQKASFIDKLSIAEVLPIQLPVCVFGCLTWLVGPSPLSDRSPPAATKWLSV